MVDLEHDALFRSSSKAALAGASLVVVGGAHVAIGYALYYCRRLGISDLFHSDVLVFLLPAAGALGANFYLMLHALHGQAKGRRIAIAATVAVVAVFVSFTVSLFVAFNALGT